MPAIAMSKGVRVSPRKLSVIAALVRNRSVADALVILEHTPRSGAKFVAETIKSAQANAEHNHSYKPGTLSISEILVTSGPRLKRWRPVWRGMAHPYQHKTSHIRVVVDGEKRQVKKLSSTKSAKKETN